MRGVFHDSIEGGAVLRVGLSPCWCMVIDLLQCRVVREILEFTLGQQTFEN